MKKIINIVVKDLTSSFHNHSSIAATLCFFFFPKVDVKTTALAMAITDSELSDEEASILESGGFSVSRATTPQLTDVSEGKGHSLQCDTWISASEERVTLF